MLTGIQELYSYRELVAMWALRDQRALHPIGVWFGLGGVSADCAESSVCVGVCLYCAGAVGWHSVSIIREIGRAHV